MASKKEKIKRKFIIFDFEYNMYILPSVYEINIRILLAYYVDYGNGSK